MSDQPDWDTSCTPATTAKKRYFLVIGLPRGQGVMKRSIYIAIHRPDSHSWQKYSDKEI